MGPHAVTESALETFWPRRSFDGPVHGRLRSPVQGLVLTLVTLGVYHFYFHAVAHGELLQQQGRKNRELPVLFAYMGLVAYGLVLGWTILFLPLVAAFALYVYWVRLQLLELARCREHLGIEGDYTTGEFLLWLVPGALIAVGPFIAYKRLIEEYNRVWSGLAKGGASAPEAAPDAKVRSVPKRQGTAAREPSGSTRASGGVAAEHGSSAALGGQRAPAVETKPKDPAAAGAAVVLPVAAASPGAGKNGHNKRPEHQALRSSNGGPDASGDAFKGGARNRTHRAFSIRDRERTRA